MSQPRDEPDAKTLGFDITDLDAKLDKEQPPTVEAITVHPEPDPIKGVDSRLNGETMNSSTKLIEDLWLWFRNRLKKVSLEGGNLIPSISSLFNVGVFLTQFWIPILAIVLIVAGLLIFKVI